MKRRRTNEANARAARSAAAAPAGGSDAERGDGVAVGTPAPEAIARRAYELFLERGAEPGHDIEDWFRAEAELREGRQ